ncbi:MAG TPA: SpoIIE family protein phosphatase [Opitutaceae bacterium]|nr:SpoIIE family protein phosphatase [Opitutaceae bacterium]
MSPAVLNRAKCVEWSVASCALPGQRISGDRYVIQSWAGGVLAGVVDGLGHGEEATAAASAAVEVLERHAGESVIALMQRCHRALQPTRGAVLTLVSIDAGENTAAMLGIGNVEAVLLRANPQARPRRESVLLRGGVVGYQLPALHADLVPFGAGDLLVFATDGVQEDFGDELEIEEPLPQLVERIMAEKFRGTDDGLVLACRHLGAS